VAAPGSVLADGGRLRQILRNVVANAQRYGGEVIRVTSEGEANDIVIVVSDSGPGIPEEMQERVFEPFATAHDESGVTASMGLGLSVSRSLATLMGGSLTYSWEDGWSRLNLRLPAASQA